MRSRQPYEQAADPDRGGRKAVPAGLLALQRAAGNRAVAGFLAGPVVQRSISHQPAGKKAQKVLWAKVSKWPDVVKADDLVTEVIRIVAGSTSINLTVTGGADLVLRATALADAPTRALINAVDDHEVLQRLLDRWALNGQQVKVKAHDDLIDQRIAELGGVGSRITGSGLSITVPAAHKGYSVPGKFVGAPANPKGRDQGKFKSITHSTSLRSKTTSSVNAHLLGELAKQGQLKAIGGSGGTLQICPTCGVDNFLESFEVDHQVAFADIKRAFLDLAEEMTGNPTLLHQVKKKNAKAFDRCFTVAKTKGKKASTVVTATAEALHVFSNDVDNLMRICRTCNGAFGKSDMNYLKWYRENPLFGPHFVEEHLCDGKGHLIPGAKGGVGWGRAARTWFNTHYYPILKDVLDLRSLTEAGRSTMIREANNRVAVDRTSDPARKRKLREDVKQDKYANRTLVGSARILTKGHTDPARARMRSGSPERQLKGLDNFLEGQERDRKRRRTEETTDYQRGHADGHAGKKQVKKTAEYKAGHAAGVAAAGKERDTGYEHGVTGVKRAQAKGTLPAYDQGFQTGTKRRADVYETGRDDGAADDDVDTKIAQPTEVGYASLLVHYLEGYNEGRGNRP
ncbi:hypothetical protein [Lentzea sp. NPDC055074]